MLELTTFHTCVCFYVCVRVSLCACLCVCVCVCVYAALSKSNDSQVKPHLLTDPRLTLYSFTLCGSLWSM